MDVSQCSIRNQVSFHNLVVITFRRQESNQGVAAVFKILSQTFRKFHEPYESGIQSISIALQTVRRVVKENMTKSLHSSAYLHYPLFEQVHIPYFHHFVTLRTVHLFKHGVLVGPCIFLPSHLSGQGRNRMSVWTGFRLLFSNSFGKVTSSRHFQTSVHTIYFQKRKSSRCLSKPLSLS